ncbi:MAG: hypothetical protein R3293_18680 [Candidatus Promineifilaceae bacterium]|nr:hypothetical protein [Candidatus Promineifilaceae bacterium]
MRRNDGPAGGEQKVLFHGPDQGNGRIDLLLPDVQGWAAVAFKTRRSRARRNLISLRAGKIEDDQLRRYGQSIGNLTGDPPRLILCHIKANQSAAVTATVTEISKFRPPPYPQPKFHNFALSRECEYREGTLFALTGDGSAGPPSAAKPTPAGDIVWQCAAPPPACAAY